MRPIDADAFKKYITDGIDGLILPKDQVEKVIAVTKSFLKDIDEQPTIEARPSGECKIYHARFEDRIACKCGFMQVITGHWDDYNYCQRCGRKALKEGEANDI